MIMNIFLLFLSLAFILTVVGYYIKENLLIIIGFLIFGLISVPLLNNNLEYRSGENFTVNYTYEGNQVIQSTSNINYEYLTYTGTVLYGIFFLLLSLSGMFMWYQGYKSDNEEDD